MVVIIVSATVVVVSSATLGLLMTPHLLALPLLVTAQVPAVANLFPLVALVMFQIALFIFLMMFDIARRL